MKSNCCLSTLITRSSDEGTSYYECKACGEPCDVAPQNQPPLDTGHHAEYDYKYKKAECEHDYDNPVRKGRAHFECGLCGKNITLELVLIQEAMIEEEIAKQKAIERKLES